MDGLLKTKEFVNKNSNSVIGTIISVLVIVGLVLGFNAFKTSRAKNAREDFGKAMVAYSEKNMSVAIDQFKGVAAKYRGSVSGTMSAFMLAGIYHSQNKLDDAITWYDAVIKGANIGFVNAQAHEGLASCYEAKSDNSNAIIHLEKALTNEHLQFRAGALRWKLALLKKESDPKAALKLCDEVLSDTLARDLTGEVRYLKALLEQ